MESIFNAPPRRPIPVRQPETGGLRGSMILVVLGLAALALGAMIQASAFLAIEMGNDAQPALGGVGWILLVAGGLSFLSGLLAEFFAIGTSLRSIASSSDATLSLLKRMGTADSESGIRNSESQTFPPRVA